VCGWVNLRSHLVISFNPKQSRCIARLTWNPIWRFPLTKAKLVCGWLNLRSHLAISFNQNQYKNVCVVLLWRVTYPNARWSHSNEWPTQMQNDLIVMGDLPSGAKGRVVLFLWVTYLGEEWPHYNGWPTQVKKDGEWSHSNGWPT